MRWLRVMWPSLLILALAVALLFGVFHWQANRCEAAGGHVIPAYKSQICVSDDGRVIEP